MDAHRDVPELALQSFESLTQLRVCVHDLCSSFLPHLDPVRSWHGGALCRQVKSGPFGERCETFELTELRPDLISLAEKGGRIHQCHAGLIEWVFPLIENGIPVAVLFAGQRRAHKWTPDVQQAASPLAAAKAAPVDEHTAQHYLEALRQLGERLLAWLRRDQLHQSTGKKTVSRRYAILSFIDQSHQGRLRITELAELLHLSPSRVAHVVREETGSTWSELVARARLKTACDLLKNSEHDLVQIAQLSGFGDQSQFHKIFKRHFSVSPGRYRRDPES